MEAKETSYQTERTKRKITPETGEISEKRDFYGDELLAKGTALLSAMISAADSSECSQTAGNAVLEAAGSIGNSALLNVLEAQRAQRSQIGAVSDILGSCGTGLVPEWADNAPENDFSAEAPFSAAAVPEFVFADSASVDFSAAESIAGDFAQ